MVNDLDEFLRMAKERRAQRQQSENRTSPAPPPRPEPPPIARPLNPQSIPVAVVVDPVDTTPDVGNLQSSLQNRHVESSVPASNDRLDMHVKDVFQHELTSLPKKKGKGSKKSKSKQNVTDDESKVEFDSDAQYQHDSRLKIIEQLRNPETLRMAIIAAEILKRPWQ